jgi:hypothetical protein
MSGIIDNTSIPAKIQELADALTGRDTEEAKKLEAWQKRFMELDGFAEYAIHPKTQYMISKAMQIVKDARAVLATNRRLSEIERERLFERIEAHLWYVDMFDTRRIEREMDGIGKSIDAELESYEAPIADIPYQAPNLAGETGEDSGNPEIPAIIDYPVRDGMPSSILLGPDMEAGDKE